MKLSRYIFVFILAIIFIGCVKTPDGVLSKEKMAQLLADIHIGESIVDAEHTKYYSDSLKKTVKQSILVEHGVSQEELDSSFSWYGRNIEEYIAVYDRVIEILNSDIDQIGTGKKERVNVSIEGDSVDTWQGLRHYTINPKSASRYITFNLSKDQNWENGDNYTWRLKLVNNVSQIKWALIADYVDGSTEFTNATASNEGWNSLKLITDSTKSLNRVYGYIYLSPSEKEQVYIDSISLIRMRVDNKNYRQRSFQKTFEYGRNKTSVNEPDKAPKEAIDSAKMIAKPKSGVISTRNPQSMLNERQNATSGESDNRLKPHGN